MADVIQSKVVVRTDHVNTIVLRISQSVAPVRGASISKIRLVWLSAVPRQVKIPLQLLRLSVSAGNGGSNLTRLHNAVPNNEGRKEVNSGASKKDRVIIPR